MVCSNVQSVDTTGSLCATRVGVSAHDGFAVRVLCGSMTRYANRGTFTLGPVASISVLSLGGFRAA